MKKVIIFILFVLASTCVDAKTKSHTVEIENPWDISKKEEPVVLSISNIGIDFEIRSVRVWDGVKEIASQLDDLDGNGTPDEIVFTIDLAPFEKKKLKLEFSSALEQQVYPKRVYAEMLIKDPMGNHIPIHSLTIPSTSNVYEHLYHHGPAFESELVAYRIYFDKKQTVDIYGKFHKQLEIEQSQFYPSDQQLADGYGDDVLRVGNSCGLGTLKGWNGKQATHLEEIEALTETIRSYGPVRTVVDVNVHKWKYQGSVLQMTIRYILYAGHRDCEVQVIFDKPLGDQIFCTGLLKIDKADLYSDKTGTLAIWGTDWPTNDTIKYKKETVGLALALPSKIIDNEISDDLNHLYTINAKGQHTFTYHIIFTSTKETFGFKTKNEWYKYVQEWSAQLKKKISIKIKS